jgi:hypothetical protein
VSLLGDVDCDNHLTLGGVLLADDWIMLENLEVLIGSSTIKGSDRGIPHGAFVRPRPRRTTATRVNLNLTITGQVDRAGAPASDVQAQLVDNLDYFRTQCVDPPDAGGLNVTAATGTRSATIALAGSVSDTKVVHTGPLRLARFGDFALLCTLETSWPHGLFEL